MLTQQFVPFFKTRQITFACLFIALASKCSTAAIAEEPQNTPRGDQADERVTEECKGAGIYILKEKVNYLSGGPGQHFSLPDNPGSMLLGDSGSKFSQEKKIIVLDSGKLIAMVGSKRPIDIITKFAEVEVPRRTAAMIQETPEGILRIDNLQGKSLTLTFRVGHYPYTFTADRGQEICLIPKEEFDQKKLVADDGIERATLSTPEISGVTLAKSYFDQRMMVSQEPLLALNPYSCDPEAFKLIANLKKHARPMVRQKGIAPEPAVFEQLASLVRRPDEFGLLFNEG